VFIILIIDFINIIFALNSKSQILNPKQIQNSNKTNSKHFDHLNFCNWNLFRVSSLEFRVLNHDRLALNIFSLANLLLPTLTGTFSSIPRYALLSVSIFIFLSQIKNNWIKITMAIIFLIFHILVLGFFGQGYFIS
jgi:hypothetical protein